MRIRPAVAGSDDLVAVAAIMEHYVLHTTATFSETPLTADEWGVRHHDIAERGLPFLVAEDDGRAVGFACVDRWRPQAAYRHTVEDTVYLDPAATGRGIGTALLTDLLAAAAAAGVREVVAVVADSGDPASAALHRSLGFVEAGRLRAVGHKHGRWIDTVLMQRSLVGDVG